MLGCAVAAWRYLYEPGVTNLMLVVGLWNFFNLLTAGASLGVCAERRQLERTPSLRSTAAASSPSPGTASTSRSSASPPRAALCASSAAPSIRDSPAVPAGNAQRRADGRRTPDRAAAGPSGQATRDGRELVMRANFGTLAIRDNTALAGLMYGDAEAMRRFQLRRRRHKDIPTGTLQSRGGAWSSRSAPCAISSPVGSRGPSRSRRHRSTTRRSGCPPRRRLSRAGDDQRGAIPFVAAKPSDAESGDDWVRLMMDYENERTLAELRGRRTSAA